MATILVSGGSGQLGRALQRQHSERHAIVALSSQELDICDVAAIDRQLDAHAPDVVINAAAYTAVDKAEDPAQRERAMAVNAQGPLNLVRACSARELRLVHVSTDYVFDGTASRPYREDDPIRPLGVYGESKALGEQAVLGGGGGGLVVRTSWLFEERGPSFVHTMLRLAKERAVLRVVSDQVGCPTWADDLARALVQLGVAATPGGERVYHYCNDGVTSWHGFATAIIEEARRIAPERIVCERVEAIATSEYPTPAKRPAYSVLDTTKIREAGIAVPSWRPGMAHVVAKVLRG
jgi:dTDP-4-dehydrorhamnose reductase